MKRQPIPQFEFGFSADTFSLSSETQPAPKASGPEILAELTEEERERVREQSRRAQKPDKRLTGTMAEAAKIDWDAMRAQSKEHPVTDPIFGAVAKQAAQDSDLKTMPGLAPGSQWSVPMAKALATMQGGGR